MNKRETIDALFGENEYVTTAEVESKGISRQYFMDYVSAINATKIANGIYRSNDAWPDPFYEIALRFKETVFSYESALCLWNLAEREPFSLSVTVKNGYNATGLRNQGIEVHNVSKEIYLLGLTRKRTNFGHEVKVYDKERTICDIVKAKNKMDIQIFQHAITGYMQSKDNDLNKLINYAEELKCEEKIRNYIEVLLL